MVIRPYEVERTSRTVTTVRMKADKKGWEQWFLLSSDRHHDNAHCDQVLEKKHLEEAAALNAGIIDHGDLFCAMQGKWDKRADPRQFRSELQGGAYMDNLVAYNAEFYQPYSEYFVLLSQGNHETGFFKRHETNLTERLAERLKQKKSPVEVGGYRGWVRFMFTCYGTERMAYKEHYTHGYGGGGPVTRGVISVSRELVYIPDCNILFGGHTHDSYHVTVARERLLGSGKTLLEEVECLRAPGYKDEFSCGEGWANERGMPPKPKGAWWVRFWLDSARKTQKVCFEVRRAK
jgi:hypothetical protein